MRILGVVLVLLLLLATIADAGCIKVSFSREPAPFSLRVKEVPNLSVVQNWSAFNLNVSVSVFLTGTKKAVNSGSAIILVLLKASDNVVNLTPAFPLGDGVYLVPSDMFSPPLDSGWRMLPLTATLRNGSYVSVEVEYKGKPKMSLGMNLNFEVERTEKGYLVRLIGAGVPSVEAFGMSYRLVPLPVNTTLSIVGIPPEKYLGNWTYILPPVNTKKEDGTEVRINYPIVMVFIESREGRAFVEKVNFPYDAIHG
ncbi:hypothetical protein [Thermococcus sp.]|uniref:hypothetical protein n=1 Tax=Thermococcus sp. TaxID=35749 RepID=UPI002635EC2D|nr:hypothetical protein [Thermococcus sp.]